MPRVLRVCEQVVHDEGPVPVQTELAHVEVEPTGLWMGRIEADDAQDDVVAGIGPLAPAHQRVVVGRVEPQVPVAVERGMIPSDRVEPSQEMAQTLGRLDVPVPYLVLL